jgi:hypothetical protein
MRKPLAISVGFVLMLGALGACGGGGSSKDAESGDGAGNDSAFTELYNKSKNAKIRVTYQNLDNAGNPKETWTISQDGAGKVAYIADDSKAVINGDSVSRCSNLETEPSCETVSGGATAAQGYIAGFGGIFTSAAAGIQAAAASGGFGDPSTETIAGRESECVQLTLNSALGRIGSAIAGAIGGAKANQGTISCIDKQTGILLKYQIIGVDDDESGVVAIEVGDPKDDDFSTPGG